jgi:hypothetical protein
VVAATPASAAEHPIGGRSTRQIAVIAAVLAGVAALAFGMLRIALVAIPPGPSADNVFTTTYDPPTSHLQAAIDVADGQAYAALAQDPTASHPEVFKDGPAEFVYRSERPLYGWLIWATSFGQPGWVPVAQLVVTALGVSALAAASVFLAAQQGRVRRWAPLVVLLPGCLLSVVILVPEALSAALAVMGVTWWIGDRRRPALALAALSLALLGREWMIIVPAVLALHDLVIGRRRFRSVLPLMIPPLMLAAWVGSLRWRHGAWPTQASSLERLAVPLAGWWRALPHLTSMVALSSGLAAVLIAIGLRRTPRSVLVWIAVVFALSTVVLGENVLSTESYRPLLAMFVFALIAVLPPEVRTGNQTRVDRLPATPR